MYGGHYPNELELIDDLKYNDLGAIDPLFYAYLAGFVVAAIITIVI